MSEKKSNYNGYTEARARANKKYNEKFVIARARMIEEEYESMKTHATAMDESVSGFINRAIRETMERDKER